MPQSPSTSSLRILRHIVLGSLLSILVFFSTSFLTYLVDLDTFNPYARHADFTVNFGFPFTYYQEFFFPGNDFPTTWASSFYLFIDCAITWAAIALPYSWLMMRRDRKKSKHAESDIIDQKEI